MMRNDHSEYAWLYPSPATNAEEAAYAFIDWCAVFETQVLFISDTLRIFEKKFYPLLHVDLSANITSPNHIVHGATVQ